MNGWIGAHAILETGLARALVERVHVDRLLNPLAQRLAGLGRERGAGAAPKLGVGHAAPIVLGPVLSGPDLHAIGVFAVRVAQGLYRARFIATHAQEAVQDELAHVTRPVREDLVL